MRLSKTYVQPAPTSMTCAGVGPALFDLLYIVFMLRPTYLSGGQNMSRFQMVTEPGLTACQQFLWLALPTIAAPLFCILLAAAWYMRQQLSVTYLRVLMLLFAVTAAVLCAGLSAWYGAASWLFY